MSHRSFVVIHLPVPMRRVHHGLVRRKVCPERLASSLLESGFNDRTEIRPEVRAEKNLDRQVALQYLADDLDVVVHRRPWLLAGRQTSNSRFGRTYAGEPEHHGAVGVDRDLVAADLRDLTDDADDAVLEVLEVLGRDAWCYAGHFLSGAGLDLEPFLAVWIWG
jgi:hypothetical protein